MNRKSPRRRAAAMIAALGILVEPSAHLLLLASGQTPTPSTAKPTPAAVAATTAPVDGGWPRLYDLASGGSILVYQPQIASWDNQSHMVAFLAVSYRNGGRQAGARHDQARGRHRVSVADRLVSFQMMKITEANFQTLPKEQVREIVAAIDKAIPDDERVIALDRVLASWTRARSRRKTSKASKLIRRRSSSARRRRSSSISMASRSGVRSRATT